MKVWLVISAASFFLQLFGVSWDEVDAKIEREFPDVRLLEVSELAPRLLNGGTGAPLLIDVRDDDEFAVSRLGGARNIKSAGDIAAQIPEKDVEIIVYCSVGYRSARVAQELIDLGYTQVKNLRHSIFAWANQGLPLTDDDGVTNKVHPYNRIWGSLLDEERHQYSP